MKKERKSNQEPFKLAKTGQMRKKEESKTLHSPSKHPGAHSFNKHLSKRNQGVTLK